MFNDKQIQALSHEIDPSRVKQRSKGNITLSYIEGHDLLDTANRIFGYGNWSYTVTSLEQVSQELNQNQNHIICYKAVVNVSVQDLQHSKQVNREDVGFGSGIAKTLADAHEGGAKEAVTDAIKRAMRSFGNQYGLSLYGGGSKPQSSYHSSNTQTSYQQQPTPQQINHTPQDYSSLYQLGLQVIDDGHGNLIITGDDIFAKKDSIKAYGFRWDGQSRVWFKNIEQQVA